MGSGQSVAVGSAGSAANGSAGALGTLDSTVRPIGTSDSLDSTVGPIGTIDSTVRPMGTIDSLGSTLRPISTIESLSSTAETADAAFNTLTHGGVSSLSGASPELQHYDSFKKIGRGSYGTVYLVRDKRDAQYYCLKQIFIDCTPTEAERRSAELEVQTLRSLDHPSIVRYHEHFVHDDSLCLVMTYCEGGDLSQRIKKAAEEGAHFGEAQVVEWFVQIAMALQHVHSKKILRNRRSSNPCLWRDPSEATTATHQF